MTRLKSIIILMSMISAILIIQSCKDDCNSLECQNGGSCLDGSCICPDGFSGINCELEDLCVTQVVECQNGGICQNGACECPEGFYGAFCQNETIQHRLASETPFEIFESGVSLDSLYGKIYSGGLIFYLNTTNGTGLVAANEDQSTNAIWGCYGVDISNLQNVLWNDGVPEGLGSKIGDGLNNTNAILEECILEDIAAKLCRDKGLEWFLPSIDELDQMYINLYLKNLGEFTNSFYWSSSESTDDKAWFENIPGGYQTHTEKYRTGSVRAAKSF